MSALAIFVMAFREGLAIFATVCNKTIYYQTLSNLPLKKGCPDYDSVVNAKLNGNRWHYGAVNVDSIWTHGQFGDRLSYLYPRPDSASSSGSRIFADDVISLQFSYGICYLSASSYWIIAYGRKRTTRIL
ncbi:hypothetical protein [Sphingobacterium chuzhouense]|uniref:Uncharacterized protein n=2 Tax=Sphingobacterium chuzhouense TaxID=1742264 RepID=A0ABR7XVR0_9SPHI|nr:hypothetical protein [Sphingobacterium chuzhouense]MBD1423144.1 hypothetical protein [Sphingobacterium chuzhouense]